MPNTGKMFNALFGGDPLEFRKPAMARNLERRGHDVDKLLVASFPVNEDYWQRWPFKRPKAGETTYRNVVAWYLIAAGLSGQEAGDFLSISASRASFLARRSRNQIFNYASNREHMREIAERLPSFRREQPEVPDEFFAAHMLRAARNEMIVAEYVLSIYCGQSDLFVISGALRRGRASYMAAYEALAGLKCPCMWCNRFVDGAPLGPYWDIEGCEE